MTDNRSFGDFNNDNIVNVTDLNILLQGWGTTYNIGDLNALLQYWQLTLPLEEPNEEPEPEPEPESELEAKLHLRMDDDCIISLVGSDDNLLGDHRLYAVQVVFNTDSATKTTYTTNWLEIGNNTNTWELNNNSINLDETDFISNTIKLDVNTDNSIILRNKTLPIVEVLKTNDERPYLDLDSNDTQILVKSSNNFFTYRLNPDISDHLLFIKNDIENQVSLQLLNNKIYIEGGNNENLSNLVLETVQIHCNSNPNLTNNYKFYWNLQDDSNNNNENSSAWLRSVDNLLLTTDIDSMVSNTVIATETKPLSLNIKNKTIEIGEFDSSDISLNTNSIYSQIVLFNTNTQKHITYRTNAVSPELKLKILNL